MPNLIPSDLSDPQPPVPGDRERSLVAARARQLGRRHRLLQGAGALGVIAAVSVSVAALTAGGTTGSGGTRGVEAASPTRDGASSTTSTTTAPSPTTAPPPTAPTTIPPTVATAATTADTGPVAPVTPAAPTIFTLSGTITGNPPDTTATVTVQGPGGQFTATADGAGNFSISGVPAGGYVAVGHWVDSSGTASAATNLGPVTIAADQVVSFSFA